MKIITVTATNFASYDQIDFDFADRGLTLIQGATGSGKSTICDLVPWVLFGKTAKNGSVNDVCRWGVEAPTTGKVELEHNGDRFTIYRARGKQGNDLYFCYDSAPVRGKDIPDTQRLINEMIGFDYETYLAGAYYHEFSQTANFFTATAKNRRALCEELVDLSLAVRLQAAVAMRTKLTVEQLKKVDTRLTNVTTRLDMNRNSVKTFRAKSDAWEHRHIQQLLRLQEKADNFDGDLARRLQTLDQESVTLKLKIQDAEDRLGKAFKACVHCGAPNKAYRDAHHDLQSHSLKLEAIRTRVEDTMRSKNTYAVHLDESAREVNPYKEVDKELLTSIETLTTEVLELDTRKDTHEEELSDLETLSDVVTKYRATTVITTIVQLQEATNALLSTYFDAEIKVVFSVESADKVEVTIYKDGHECAYPQLSKGQRQLLKLCFGVSAMESVTNHKGVHFNAIFIDEALDGLDEDLKVKTIGLLQALAAKHDSVFVVEHSNAFKVHFDNKITVALNNGISTIEEA